MGFCLDKRYVDAMVSHARAEAPLECCGILAGADGRVLELFRAANVERSPLRYKLDPREILGILREVEGKGWEVLGFYHSHTISEAYPSPADKAMAFWPECLYFIVSLRDPERPVVRAFWIVEGEVIEETLDIAT